MINHGKQPLTISGHQLSITTRLGIGVIQKPKNSSPAKTIKESIATIEEIIFTAKQQGDTRALKAAELTLKALKRLSLRNKNK
jgi:hypothetical protein